MPNSDDYNKDFQGFLNAKGKTPSNDLDNKIINFVKNDLNPSRKLVFGKMLGIQAFIGTITLLFCPQFNMSLTNNHDLFHYFHHNFGDQICMAICGLIFVGSGSLFASYALKQSEVKVIKDSRILYFMGITTFALTSFLLLGADIYLKLATFWFLGASLGGIVIFELNSKIRSKIFHY
jgi:hypothetical protein